MAPKKLPEKNFLETFKYVPRVAVNILVKNGKGEVLLTKRAIPPEEGDWHYPGAFILKNERIDDCFKRVSQKELGVRLNPGKKKILGVFENLHGDPRGHIIDLVYEYKLTGGLILTPTKESAEIKFFKKLPAKIGFNHKSILGKLGYK